MNRISIGILVEFQLICHSKNAEEPLIFKLLLDYPREEHDLPGLVQRRDGQDHGYDR